MSLKALIAEKLPLTVHDYMQLCLQHPEFGYYQQAIAVGAQGDFVTAPEISQIFGDILGLWLRHTWQELAEPEFDLVELGPGRGTLSADVLRHLPACGLHLVESNRTLKTIQAQTLQSHHPTWHKTIASFPRDKPLFIIANEFFDAFAIRQWVGDVERVVTPQFEFSPKGAVTREESPQASAWVTTLCERLKQQGGLLWICDYGTAEGEQGDSLQGVKNHQYYSPLDDCGQVDLTAHVNFKALAQTAQSHGCTASAIVPQEKFLRSLGAEMWLQKLLTKCTDVQQQKTLQEGWIRLISPAQMGTLFKVMAITPHETPTLAGF